MIGREVESRLIKPTDVRYDQSGNSFVPEYIDDVEIINVGESTRFIRPKELDSKSRQILLGVLRDTQPHIKISGDDLSEGKYFSSCLSRGSETTDIPAEILIGTIGIEEDRLVVVGNVLISFHAIGDKLEPKIIGFEITNQPTVKPLRQNETMVAGVSLSPERYQIILTTLQAIPEESTIPHPGTKEFVRQGKDFREMAKSLQSFGLVEIPGAMFKFEGGKKETKNEELEWTLVAVHPYYLEYHDSFGEKDKLSPEARAELLKKYDALFTEHRGSLVVVEEESKVTETLTRLKQVGRQGNTYFVLTEDRKSSNFPYTNNSEFMNLLKQLGLKNLKFVGGHDSGDKPYQTFDPAAGNTTRYSGCLRGLANRIEKRGFPKIKTMSGYIYS